MSRDSFRVNPEQDAKDARAIALKTEKINAISLRAFTKNAGQIKLGKTYSARDVEFFFNIRFDGQAGAQLLENLKNRFEFTGDEKTSFTFTKDKEAQV